nr:flavin-containing monooxygenase fmo gs-ox-like 5 [Quercus suber]
MVVNERPMKRMKRRIFANLYDFHTFPTTTTTNIEDEQPFKVKMRAFLEKHAHLMLLHFAVVLPDFMDSIVGASSLEDMMEDVEAFYSSLEASSTPKPYTHCVGNNMVEYNNWLAGQCGGLIYMKNGEYQCVVPHSRAESPNPSLIAMNGKINT